MDERFERAALASELTFGAEPPREVLLIPAGEIPTRPHDGRAPWRNTNPDAVVRATRELALDLPIDYEHQGERSRENGQPAPAAGWIRRVFERAGAVWGEVEWTERAASMLKAREYRFLSPLFNFDRTRQVRRVLGAGLTNDPAMYMRAIATTQQGEEMDKLLQKLREALGLKPDAGEDQVLQAATAAAAGSHELVKIAKVLGLAGDAELANVTTTAMALVAGRKAVARAAGLEEGAAFDAIEGAVRTAAAGAGGGDPDPSRFVPRAEFDAVRGRLDALESTGAEDRASAAVDAAITAGKVTPASRSWALGYAKKDPEGFAEFVGGAPTILSDGRVAPATREDGDAERLTAEERAVCRATGVSEKDFIASKKALAGETEGS